MEFTAYDIALIPLIMAVVQTFKLAGVPSRWNPLLALALGMAAAFVYVAPGDPKQAVLAGLVIGLTAIGAWSGAKNTVGK